jgi:hypothetical protein
LSRFLDLAWKLWYPWEIWASLKNW